MNEQETTEKIKELKAIVTVQQVLLTTIASNLKDEQTKQMALKSMGTIQRKNKESNPLVARIAAQYQKLLES